MSKSTKNDIYGDFANPNAPPSHAPSDASEITFTPSLRVWLTPVPVMMFSDLGGVAFSVCMTAAWWHACTAMSGSRLLLFYRR
jgi:hypothetical protein